MLWTTLTSEGRPWLKAGLLRSVLGSIPKFLWDSVDPFFPQVIHVYAKKHQRLRHDAYGKLGDRVMVAIMGQKKKGIIVGLKQKQLPNVPRFDSNNIVLIEENGNPSGNRITAPLPNVIRPGLAKDSNPKKADYTKLFAIATKWV